MELTQYVQENTPRINECLKKILACPEDKNKDLTDMMEYAVFPGGKRIRPILAMAAARATGGDAALAIAPGCAIEIIHCYSLVHDDLPAMDDDDLRRGKPTVHKVVGEGVAILVGDALLTLAFEVLANAAGISDAVKIKLVRELAQAAGKDGIIAGQTVDLESEGKPITRDTLEYIHQHKTADLLAASVRMGAMTAKATAEQLNALTVYGNKLGLLFQVVDDILDVTGDENLLGKPVGSDEGLQKATFPALVGLEESKRIAHTLAEEAQAALAIFDEQSDILRAIIALVLNRNH